MSCSNPNLSFASADAFINSTAKSDAGQRCAQFVGSIGEQSLVPLHQLLDLPGGAIEALGKTRHFVAAFHGDTGREIAGAERFDSALQALQASGDLPHDGEGCDSDGEREQGECAMEHEPWVRVPDGYARGQPAAVGQMHV